MFSTQARTIRIASLLLLGILCVFVGSTPVWAKAPKVYTIKLPKESCNIKERWKGGTKKTIIHIQDAHSNVDAQRNIAQVIKTLVEENDITLVGIEGASQEIDLGFVQSFPAHEAVEESVDWYVRTGVLSGAEKALATTPGSFSMVGIEDRDLFRKNFRAYFGTSLKRENILDQLEEIEHILNDLKTPLYSEELNQFDSFVAQWERGETPLITFLFELEKNVRSRRMETLDYIHYAAFQEAVQLKARINQEQMEAERTALEDALMHEFDAQKLTSDMHVLYLSFVKKRDSFAKEAIAEVDYLEFLKYCSRKMQVPFSKYAAIKSQLGFLRAFSRLDMLSVITDARNIAHAVRSAMATTEPAKKLVAVYARFMRAKHIVELTAMNTDIEYYRAHADAFDFEQVLQFLDTFCQTYGKTKPVIATARDLNKLMSYAMHFYQGAELRNTALVDNTIAAMDARGEKTSVIVTGGYHTTGITHELQEKDISYLVVTPKINSFESLDTYSAKMSGQLMPLSPQLVGYINALITDPYNLAGGRDTVDALLWTVLVRSSVTVFKNAFRLHEDPLQQEILFEEVAGLVVRFAETISKDRVLQHMRDIIAADGRDQEKKITAFVDVLRGDPQYTDAVTAGLSAFATKALPDVGVFIEKAFSYILATSRAMGEYFASADESVDVALARRQHEVTAKLLEVLSPQDAYYGTLSRIMSSLQAQGGVRITVFIDPHLRTKENSAFLSVAEKMLMDIGGDAITIVRDGDPQAVRESSANPERILVLKDHETDVSDYPESVLIASFDLDNPAQCSAFQSMLLQLLAVVTAAPEEQEAAFDALSAYLVGSRTEFDLDVFATEAAAAISDEVESAHRQAITRSSA